MLTDLWFVAEAGAQSWSGPFSGDEMRSRIADGRFQRARVWRPGWQAWEGIGAHFEGAAGSSPTAIEPVAQGPNAPPAKKAPLLTIAIWAMVFAVAGLSLLLFGDVTYYRFGDAAPFAYAAVWGLADLLVLTIAILVWRRAGVAGSSGLWRAGRAVSAMLAICAVAFSFVFVRMTGAIHNIAEARKNFANYQLSYDPTTRIISFRGPIGPGFSDRLAGILNANAGVRLLRIENSPGGLVDEALDAARRIEASPQLAVEADSECNSACVALFMAARDRRAEYAAEFGFHQGGFVSNVPAVAMETAHRGLDQFREFVVRHGLPAASFDAWSRSTAMHAVSAIELREMNVVGALLNHDEPLEVQQAKWLWIAGVTAGAEDGFSDLAEALAVSGEPALLQAASPIFSAARGGDRGAMRGAVQGIMRGLLPKVLESADPAASIGYVSASGATLGYLSSMENWTECASAVDGHGMSDNAVPKSFVRDELRALAVAVRSASDADWVSRPLPSWASGAGMNVIQATIEDAAKDGYDNSRYESDPRVRCVLTQRMLVRVQRGDPTRSVVAYRWILYH